MIALLAVLATSGDPVLVEPAPPEPPPEPSYTHLGMRIGGGSIALADRRYTTLGLIQLTADLELTSRVRSFAEYEFLMLMTSGDRPMEPDPDGLGHRADLGVALQLARTHAGEANLYIAGEAGGGAMLVTGAVGARMSPHAFAGLRFGFEIILDGQPAHAPRFGIEVLARAIAMPEGPGMMFGIGMLWGQ